MRGGGTLETGSFVMDVCISKASMISPWLLVQQQGIFFLPWLTPDRGLISYKVPPRSHPHKDLDKAWLQCLQSVPPSISFPLACLVWGNSGMMTASHPGMQLHFTLKFLYCYNSCYSVNITSQFSLILPPVIFPHSDTLRNQMVEKGERRRGS